MLRRRRKVLFVLLAVAFVLAGVAYFRRSDPTLDLSTTELRDGDLIFVRGSSWRGLAVVGAEGGFGYSHVGIVRVSDGRVWVIHASPGAGEAHYVRRQPLAAFIRTTGARRVAVYRVQDVADGAGATASQCAARYCDAHTPFDDAYNLEEDASVYCSELVWRAWLAAGVDLCGDRARRLSVPFLDHPVILPSSLLEGTPVTLVVQQSQ